MIMMTKRILVHCKVKVKHFRPKFWALMTYPVSAASYRTAIDLFYDGTNHAIN